MFGMVLIFVSMASISAGSLDNLGTFKKGECVELTQTCTDCSYITFTQVMYPNSTTAAEDISATKDGISFNASFCKTSETGTYKVFGVGDLDGEDTVFAYEFEVKEVKNQNLVNIMFFVTLGLGLLIYVFAYSRDESGHIILMSGAFLITSGIIALNFLNAFFSETITDMASILIIGIGLVVLGDAIYRLFPNK